MSGSLEGTSFIRSPDFPLCSTENVNRMRLITFNALLVLLAGFRPCVAAGLDDALAKLDATGPKFTGMIANLARTTYTKVLNEKSTESGTIKLRKQGKDLQAYIEFTQPDPKSVAFRGKKAEVFYPKMNTVQQYDLGKQSDLLDQFLLVGFGTTGRDLKDNYSPTLA